MALSKLSQNDQYCVTSTLNLAKTSIGNFERISCVEMGIVVGGENYSFEVIRFGELFIGKVSVEVSSKLCVFRGALIFICVRRWRFRSGIGFRFTHFRLDFHVVQLAHTSLCVHKT